MEDSIQHFKIAVIGRTGAGKTTFINCLANHMLGTLYNEDRVVVITQSTEMQTSEGEPPYISKLECTFPEFKKKQSESEAAQSQSQTTRCSSYRLYNDRFQLTIVDTPGIGDTGGLEVDQKHCNEISAAVGAMTNINAVILVHKSSDSRKDVMLKYMLREIQGILPKKCKDNLLVAFTAVTDPTKIDATDALKEMGIPLEDNYFNFDNAGFFPESEWLKSEGGSGQPPSKTMKKIIRNMKNSWEDAATEFDLLFERLSKLTQVATHGFMEISVKKKAIQFMVSKNFHKSLELEIMIRELNDKLDEYQNVRKKMEENQDYKSTKTRMVRKEIPVIHKTSTLSTIYPNKVLFCLMCRLDCHVPCSMCYLYRGGNLSLASCEVFGGNENSGKAGTTNCTHCTHSVSSHSHSYKKRVYSEYKTTQSEYVSEDYEETDHSKEELYKHSKKVSAQLAADYHKLSGKVEQKQHELDLVYRTIAYLQYKLQCLAYSADNEFLLEFLDYQTKLIKEDPNLSKFEKARKLSAIESSTKEYNLIKEAVRRDQCTLTREEERQVDYKLQDIEDEQWALVGDYTMEMQD